MGVAARVIAERENLFASLNEPFNFLFCSSLAICGLVLLSWLKAMDSYPYSWDSHRIPVVDPDLSPRFHPAFSHPHIILSDQDQISAKSSESNDHKWACQTPEAAQLFAMNQHFAPADLVKLPPSDQQYLYSSPELDSQHQFHVSAACDIGHWVTTNQSHLDHHLVGDHFKLAPAPQLPTSGPGPGPVGSDADGVATGFTSPVQSLKRNASIAGFDSSPASGSVESPEHVGGDDVNGKGDGGRRRPVKRACNECRQQKVSPRV